MPKTPKSLVRFVRNPNSPEAIQQRLDGYAVTTPYLKHHYVGDPIRGESFIGTIFIDLTQEIVDQKVNYPLYGGTKALNKKLVRNTFSLDSQGRAIITSYYTDVRDPSWVIVKGFANITPPPTPATSLNTPFPRPTYGETFGGFFASARGENWRNEGRSVDEIHKIQKRIYSTVALDPNEDYTKAEPTDEFTEDFTGKR